MKYNAAKKVNAPQYAINAHRLHKGKLEMKGLVRVDGERALATYYTPGVAYPCIAIQKDQDLSFDYTIRGRSAAIVTDGTRILGLGDIGPYAGMPVMEGKALLLKKLAGVDAMPICLNSKNEDEIVNIVASLEPTFSVINIEDIETPKCLRIVRRLSNQMQIPIFHDDSIGVAVVTLAALRNALRLAGKKIKDVKIVINGAGAAGMGIASLLHNSGVENIYVVDSEGLIYEGRKNNMNAEKAEISKFVNKEKKKGGLEFIVKGADVLIGASVKGAFTKEMIRQMAKKPIVFALANPFSEIDYIDAKSAGAFIVATGRSDRPNQVNNLLVFPGIIRGLLECRPKELNYAMLDAAAMAIEDFQKHIDLEHIIPSPIQKRALENLAPSVAAAVVKAANISNLARVKCSPLLVYKQVKKDILRYNSIEHRIK